MKISTRGRYAIRMLQDIASQQDDRCITLKEIAERQGISLKYLEQIAKELSKAGVLETSRGHGGGYRLHGQPSDYTIYDILCIAGEAMAPVACLQAPQNICPRRDHCATLPIWEGLDRVVREYLQAYTIEDLVEDEPEKAKETIPYSKSFY